MRYAFMQQSLGSYLDVQVNPLLQHLATEKSQDVSGDGCFRDSKETPPPGKLT